ncbi:LysR family transcriptional regulator [Lacibacterium aquatile]|uniref:LysR family transcriptional regulator n=1 Tax=Lacibacterium aquatile TaxID=1168082 RepID=A0ABW5DUT0_9PROT
MAVFVKAVDLGSFAAAADALGMSGPMVGKHVRFLEERLGVRLLNRTTRRQSLTDFGQTYYERCRLVLFEAEAADALAADQLAEPRGRLRVTLPALFGRYCVVPVLLELARKYPVLELDLSFGDRFDDLAEGGFDLAIRTGVLADSAGLITRRVARQPMLVCAAPSYLETQGTPESLQDLAGHQAILYRRSGRAAPWLFPNDGAEVAEISLPSRFHLDDMGAIADAAVAGMGLVWLPFWLVQDRIRSGALRPVLRRQPPFLYDVHALWLQTPHLPRKVRVAVDALAAELPKHQQYIADYSAAFASGADFSL